MYSDKLEKLIDIALEESVLSEKTKQVLYNSAEAEGICLNEFELVLGARIRKLEQSKAHQENSEKRSALAALLKSFEKAEQNEKEKLKPEIENLLTTYNNNASNVKEMSSVVGTAVGSAVNAFFSATTYGLSDLV